jgi:MtrB/PioB family decaheme-associated outer membrane protein
MKTRSEKLEVSVLTLAVRGALAAMFAVPMMAQAADDEVNAFTQPANFVEIGAVNVSQKSAKFGEYNGLNKDGAEFLGNFSVGGGDAYEAYNGGNGSTRWAVEGKDLGTTSRSIGGSLSNQGKWDLNLGFDELRHNVSDTYQTPLQGNMGGNVFTLPTNFGAINGAAPAARVLTATQLGAFHTENVGTTRKNTSFGAGFNLNQQWSVKFDYNHLDQSGAKLLGSGSQGGINLVGGSTGRAEAVNILMNPTNYKTDTFNLALNWVGDKGHLTGSYYGSIFRDGYNSVSFQNAMTTAASACVGAACFVNNAMSTAPDNTFHQMNLSGGYAFSSRTKLVGGVSYGRTTQNDNYTATSIMQPSGVAYNMMQVGGLPQSSLDGSVVTTHANLKLTNQATKDLQLSAGFKYNERDNRTSSNTYSYLQLGNGAYTGVNTPYSNKKTQFELAGDYRLSKGQNLRLAYGRENIKRECSNVVGGAQCVVSPSSGEDKLGLTYRLKASDNVKLNAGYTYSKRNADFDHNFRANAGNYSVVTPTGATSLNAGDFAGFVAYPYASRKQDIFKAGINWQATERLDLGASGRYSQDKYDATLGVQDGDTKSINLDATYSFSEESSISAYATWQSSARNLQAGAAGGVPAASVTVAPTNVWANTLEQDSNSLGLNAKIGGLMGGKLQVLTDLAYSFDKSVYSTQVPFLASCSTAAVLTCGSTPDVKATLFSFKLTGTYKVDKHSKVALAYLYQNLKSDDYYYNGYQYGYTPNRVVPSNEQAPKYSASLVAATYIYSF